jgi:two-component system phosphate regulon sensor histidine kinase PhoR
VASALQNRLLLTFCGLVAFALLVAWGLSGWLGVALGVAVALGVTILPAIFFSRRFAEPLDRLAEGARKLAEGDFSHRLHAQGPASFVTLARTFNGMSERLAGSFALLERDREQLRTILSGMVEGVIAMDDNQRVLFANDRAGELLHFTPATAVGKKLWELARRPSLQQLLETAVRNPEPTRQELEGIGPLNKSLAVYVSRWPGVAFGGAVVVLHDTTELRKLERVRQEFVANVSHELKTPLANIKSGVEVLQDGAAEDPASRAEFLQQIGDHADRLEALILDLISLARVESGELKLDLEPLDVAMEVEACLARHRTRAQGLGHTLIVTPPDTPTHVVADREALGQILDNLVDNALKYTPAPGTITVAWAPHTETVALTVTDTGTGISERDLPRVFERFYRVDKARSREKGGTGLGLAIVKHLAMSMNGAVSVSSKPGAGSTFRVTLPRANVETADAIAD